MPLGFQNVLLDFFPFLSSLCLLFDHPAPAMKQTSSQGLEISLEDATLLSPSSDSLAQTPVPLGT